MKGSVGVVLVPVVATPVASLTPVAAGGSGNVRVTCKTRAFSFFLLSSAFNYANTCDRATNPLPTSWKGGRRTTVTATRCVRCTFPAIVQINAIPRSGSRGAGVRVLRGASSTELVRGRIAAKNSSLTFDGRYCRATPVPGVG